MQATSSCLLTDRFLRLAGSDHDIDMSKLSHILTDDDPCHHETASCRPAGQSSLPRRCVSPPSRMTLPRLAKQASMWSRSLTAACGGMLQAELHSHSGALQHGHPHRSIPQSQAHEIPTTTFQGMPFHADLDKSLEIHVAHSNPAAMSCPAEVACICGVMSDMHAAVQVLSHRSEMLVLDSVILVTEMPFESVCHCLTSCT